MKARRWSSHARKRSKCASTGTTERLLAKTDTIHSNHREEKILPPADLIRQNLETQATLNADIDRILAQITKIIDINLEDNKLLIVRTMSGQSE